MGHHQTIVKLTILVQKLGSSRQNVLDMAIIIQQSILAGKGPVLVSASHFRGQLSYARGGTYWISANPPLGAGFGNSARAFDPQMLGRTRQKTS